MSATVQFPSVELDDIQGGVMRPLPFPYTGRFVLFHIDDPDRARTLLDRLIPDLRTAARPADPDADAWLSVAFSFAGLQALGVPQVSLDSFPAEFRAGMAARADRLHDTGDSAPDRWKPPWGTPRVHVAVSAMAPDATRFAALAARLENALTDVGGVTAVYQLDCHSPNGREPFGFKANISHPAIAGSGTPPTNPGEPPLATGEFILGYPDETGLLPPMPDPEVLGRNGSFLVVRQLHQRVAAFRRYLHEQATEPGEETRLAAKIMGRWPSGAPLALAPDDDDPALGADPSRNNDFGYADDPLGLACPAGSHARRMNPRDAPVLGDPRRHRILRREAAYGPELPAGVLDDDGADRGIVFASVGASIGRQFEFVQEEWVNSGIFFGSGTDRDPLCGANADHGAYTIPARPIRRRLQALPSFVITRGGEYFFLPGLSALRWLADGNASGLRQRSFAAAGGRSTKNGLMDADT